uniref:Putative methyltransferase n=1 Tax=viral metagenome TaxID=1070528 RepID=A0A6M3J8R1_9ZZZZ
MKELNLVTPLHKATARKYIERMNDDKVHCMLVSKKYGYDYWDGDRRYGYGGYKYDGRWGPVARRLIDYYSLPPNARILDVGCGKAHLLYEFKQLLPDCEITGMDTSQYAALNIPDSIQPCLLFHKAEAPYPYPDKYFNLVISLMTLHNLNLPKLEVAIKEIERVGKNKYIFHESFRNEQEQFNLQCWALTAATEIDKESWLWLYKILGYTGDYEFAYFE